MFFEELDKLIISYTAGHCGIVWQLWLHRTTPSSEQTNDGDVIPVAASDQSGDKAVTVNHDGPASMHHDVIAGY